MIEIDFGPAGGGLRTFRDVAALSAHIASEDKLWKDGRLTELLSKAGSQQAVGPLRGAMQRWQSLAQQLQLFQNQHSNDLTALVRSFQMEINGDRPISADSEEGIALTEIAGDMGLEAAVGALQFYRAQDGEAIFGALPKRRLFGALEFWSRRQGFSSRGAAATRGALTKYAQTMGKATAEHEARLENIEETRASTFQELVAAIGKECEDFAAFRSQADEQINADRRRWESAWDEKLRLYTEQLKIRAAVSQWADRATTHEASFRRQRRWVIGVGVAGGIVAAFVVWGALAFARWLFSDAFVQGVKTYPPGTLRPTWGHELLLSASISLLYLTLFLWTMRLLVRMMMTEHHLAIDSRSRESMAHTYLALIEEGAADEKDRTVVLASLFRPVTDGIVKDDALPLISPATILSAHLAGSSK